MMMAGWVLWSLTAIPLFALAIVCTHLVISGGQTLMHYWLGHSRFGGPLYRNHINFHHSHYARGHLTSSVPAKDDGNNTPFFLVPVILAALLIFFVLPFDLFVAVALTAGGSFYAHVYFDKAYHFEGSGLERFAWYRRKQQLHFVHHLHANSNFAVIDFFWDRLFRTYRNADTTCHEPPLSGSIPFRAKQDRTG
jgi:sterol desaturase/sphingolipid hydroxylase (fatty acid hydroxylase superfamily)